MWKLYQHFCITKVPIVEPSGKETIKDFPEGFYTLEDREYCLTSRVVTDRYTKGLYHFVDDLEFAINRCARLNARDYPETVTEVDMETTEYGNA